MMWYATLKWEAIHTWRYLRWAVAVFAVLWTVLMVLSYFAGGARALWVLYLVMGAAANFVCIVYPVFSMNSYVSKNRLAENLSSRGALVYAVVKLCYAIMASAAGWGMIELAAIPHKRLGLDMFQFAEFWRRQTNLLGNLPFGTLIGMVLTAAVFVPAYLFFTNSVTQIPFKGAAGRWLAAFTPLVFGFFVGVVVFIVVSDVMLFTDAAYIVRDVIAMTSLVGLPVACILGGVYIYDNKAEMEPQDGIF